MRFALAQSASLISFVCLFVFRSVGLRQFWVIAPLCIVVPNLVASVRSITIIIFLFGRTLIKQIEEPCLINVIRPDFPCKYSTIFDLDDGHGISEINGNNYHHHQWLSNRILLKWNAALPVDLWTGDLSKGRILDPRAVARAQGHGRTPRGTVPRVFSSGFLPTWGGDGVQGTLWGQVWLLWEISSGAPRWKLAGGPYLATDRNQKNKKKLQKKQQKTQWAARPSIELRWGHHRPTFRQLEANWRVDVKGIVFVPRILVTEAEKNTQQILGLIKKKVHPEFGRRMDAGQTPVKTR